MAELERVVSGVKELEAQKEKLVADAAQLSSLETEMVSLSQRAAAAGELRVRLEGLRAQIQARVCCSQAGMARPLWKLMQQNE